MREVKKEGMSVWKEIDRRNRDAIRKSYISLGFADCKYSSAYFNTFR